MKHRVDYNQREIVNCMRSLGATVAITSDLGNGFPDLVVGYKGVNYLIEVKDGHKAKFTKVQQNFHGTWRGQLVTFYSIDDAIKFLKDRSTQPTNFCNE